MRDLRNIGSTREYCDVYWLYPSDVVDGNTLELREDAVALCRFRSRDVEDFRWENPKTPDGTISSVIQYRGKIETMDDLSMARPDMIVKSEDGTLFIIEAPLETANYAPTTAIGKRPNIKYRFTLRGLAQ